MNILKSLNLEEIITGIKIGKLAVIPTDTIYGIVTNATNEESVNKIYEIKKRAPEKPFIILIADVSDLKKFNISIRDDCRLSEFWPGQNSLILKCDNDKFNYLTRGTKSLAFRLPKDDVLRDFLRQTGPVVAPSANPEGLAPAVNINEAIKYFGDKIDFYVDSGYLTNPPSSLFDLTNDLPIRLR